MQIVLTDAASPVGRQERHFYYVISLTHGFRPEDFPNI